MTRDVQLIHQILNRYRFVEPVEDTVRAYLPLSRKRALKFCLKQTGDYSIWFGLVLFILFAARRFGFNVSLAASKVLLLISLAAVIAATSGGIVIATHPQAKPVSSMTKPEPVTEETPAAHADQSTAVPVQQTIPKDTPQQSGKEPVDITLYTGKTYHGVIVSRGKNIVVETAQGEVTIPAEKVKMVHRAP